MPFSDAALLLLGHGSTLNADSSAPTYQHAEKLRQRGIFAEVQVGFWKEEPNFRQALRQTGCRRVFVVPNFISSGYFTEQVIPRELGLEGAVMRRGGQEIFYCDPVGLHPSMREALLQRAREIVAQSGEALAEPEKSACLLICGHGTSLNDNSTKIIHEQAEAIRALGLYADCQGVLMEQAPFVKNWRTLTSCPDVIVVPFFIADGLHSFEDIPVLLGMKRGEGNPHREGKRRLWYSMAIGTEPFLADVIVAQVEKAAAGGGATGSFGFSETGVALAPIEEALREFTGRHPAPWKMGEVLIGADLSLRHVLDAEVKLPLLRVLGSPAELREEIRLDDCGKFRPLRAAPSLRRGWLYRAGDVAGLRVALDYLYPAELGNWLAWRADQLPETPWRETAERQTGRFRVVRELGTDGVRELVAEVCEKDCLKRRLWLPAAEAVSVGAGELPLLCPEACNYFVSKAREKLKGAPDDGPADGS
jgi:sirohydrochlorin cobaltochelatase